MGHAARSGQRGGGAQAAACESRAVKSPVSLVRNALLEVHDLTFAWPGQEAILDVPAFQLDTREHVFLHGPSGSGKTTLLGLLAGVLCPQSGTVTFRDTVISSLSASRRDRWRADHVGYIFQQFNLLPYLTVLENVLLPLRFSARARRRYENHDHASTRARHLMQSLGLDPVQIVNARVGMLSVGQQQRVAAARALVTQPDLLIADEPTSSLDADARGRFLALLFDACSANETAVVFVSHDLMLANLFDRTVRLSDINRASRS